MENENLSLEKLIKECESLSEFRGVYPVPLGSICEKLGVDFCSEEMSDDLSGLISYEDGKYSLKVNDAHSILRKRFTVAHELGHYLLHQDILKKEGKILERSVKKTPTEIDGVKREREANEFAAELLMPEKHFIERYREFQYAVLEQLSEYFAVSVAAVRVRLLNLGIVLSY